MKIKITTDGKARGTNIWIDGERIPLVTNLTLSIPIASNTAVLQIDRHSTNEEGRLQFAGTGDDKRPITERHIFSGSVSVEIEGAISEKLIVDDIERTQTERYLQQILEAIAKLNRALPIVEGDSA